MEIYLILEEADMLLGILGRQADIAFALIFFYNHLMDQTVVLVKPDGVQRGLIGEIIHRFERKGLHLVALKMVNLSSEVLEEWYAHHKDKPFFPSLKGYMQSYPVVAMVWEGMDVAATVRTMIGITKARDAAPGTIRGDFGMSQQYNLIHASESAEAAAKEVSLLFKPEDIFPWQKLDKSQIYSEEELG